MVRIVAMLCVFGLGTCFSLLGSISVKLMPRLKIDQGRFGALVSAFMLACLAASLIVGIVIDMVGYKPVAASGFFLSGLCTFWIARGRSYAAVLAPCVLLGFGAIALNTAGNTLLPAVLFEGKNPAAALNLGNVCFGLGVLLTPLIVSFLFQKVTYEKRRVHGGADFVCPHSYWRCWQPIPKAKRASSSPTPLHCSMNRWF